MNGLSKAAAIGRFSPSPPSEEKNSAARGGQFRGAVMTVSAQALSSATTFFRVVLLARACSTAEVGLYAMAFTAILLMFAAHERLIEAGYAFSVHGSNRHRPQSLLGSTIVISLCFSILGALGTLGAAAVASWGWFGSAETSRDVALALVAAALAIPPIVFRELARSVSCSHFDFVALLIIDGMTLAVQASLIVTFWQIGVLGVETMYLAIGLSSGLACVWWAIRWRDKWSVAFHDVLPDWREMWSYSRWLLASRALGHGSRVLMPWLVAWYLGAEGAGVLAACVTLVGVSWIFVRGMNSYIWPTCVYAFRHFGASALRRVIVRAAYFFTLMLGGLCLVYAFAGDWLYYEVFGERRENVWIILVLQGLVTLTISLVAVASHGLAAIDRPRSTMWIEGVSMFVTIVSAAALIPSSALVGASIAMLLGSSAGAAVAFLLMECELRRMPPGPRLLHSDLDLGAARSEPST